MIDTSAFKTTIIDLAVTGQLSLQFQADDSVEEITAALPPLSNKRKKLLGQNFEYGKQASLPDHWRWICLGEISSYGDTPTKAFSDGVSGDTWILDLEDIRSGGQIIKKTRVHGKKFIGDKTVFREGQVLYSKLRPYLKKVLVADEDGISTPELISFDTYGGVIPQYVVYCLLSSFTDRAIEKRSYGIKMPRIDAAFMVNLPIPVPPISEQQFIVERVQKAFSQIDTIDELQMQYTDNLSALKGKLIDAAIQGKLTEQLQEDGTAEDLYQQIQVEELELIREGKFKKKKPMPEISEEEKTFEIPSNWKWVRLGDLISIESGIGLTAAEMISGDVPVYGGNGVTGYHNKSFVPEGTVVIGRVGYYCGSVHITTTDSWVTDNAFITTYPANSLDREFLVQVLRKMKLGQNNNGSAQPVVSGKKIYPLAFPLPPLAEQRRIATRLKEVLPICEGLK